MTSEPPSYNDAIRAPPPGPASGVPAISVSGPPGGSSASGQGHGLSVEERERAQAQHDASDSDSSDDEDGLLHPEMTESDRRSFDDEYRDLPEGWVRCWDPKWVGQVPEYSVHMSCKLILRF
jgi:hypothetical protein